MTCWTKDVSPNNVLPEYPHSQMKQAEWKNLNGLWPYKKGELDTPSVNQECTDSLWDRQFLKFRLTGRKSIYCFTLLLLIGKRRYMLMAIKLVIIKGLRFIQF